MHGFDRARDIAVSEISAQERALLGEAAGGGGPGRGGRGPGGRRASSPGTELRAAVQQQIQQDSEKWQRRFTQFMGETSE